jgi:glycosyltransferase involved in cell wall biosynthesis
MNPLVSVVIPAYNSARTVRPAIDSALAQTMNDLEVIVVDDGSTDGTAEVARAVDDRRVNVLVQENAGAAAARNTAIAAASGRYVGLLDADDLWLPHKLERQLELLQSRADVSAVQTGVFNVDDQLRLLAVKRCTQSHDPLLDTLCFRNMPGNMSTLLIERAKFEQMGVFDTSLVILEEWDMHIKCARYCNLQSLAEPLALYRIYPGNRSRDLDIHIEPGFKVLVRLFADPDLPPHIASQKRAIYGRFYTMLAGGAFKVGRWRECSRWAGRALLSDPRMLGYMLGLPSRRLRRRLARVREPAFETAALGQTMNSQLSS